MKPTSLRLQLAVLLVLLATRAGAQEITGEIAYEPPAGDASVVEFFRLAAHSFEFRQAPIETVSKQIKITSVTFRSPVETPHANNNTVHCEYFRPAREGVFPGVVVLHILGGDFDLSRLFSRHMASAGVAALFVKMPYYGPRAEPGISVSMIDAEPEQIVAGMKQAVLDIRRAAAWLAAQEEVDADQLGISGVSLGAITGALALTAEPRFKKAFLMLGGGDIAQIGWESPGAAPIRDKWLARGGTRESLIEVLSSVDPVRYAGNVADREIIMLSANHDEVIPRACTESLWNAFGQPQIVWVDAGHYTAGRFIFDALALATRFFQP